MNYNIKPYYNEDKTATAVLVSPGYGSGWSTYNMPELAYDKRVVEYWLQHSNDKEWLKDVSGYRDTPARMQADEFFNSIGYPDLNFYGFQNIILKWVPLNMPFVIEEYDGAEYLMQRSDFKWTVLN